MIKAQTIEQYKIARYLEDQFAPGSVTIQIIGAAELLVVDKNGDALVFYMKDQSGEIENREPEKDPEALELAKSHREAYENWPEGQAVATWRDQDGTACIMYQTGRWWHYKQTDGGSEWW